MRSSYPLFFLLLVPLFFLISCTVRDPDFRRIENVRVSRVGLKETNLNVDLLYYNPNTFRVKLRRAEGDAWLDSNFLGHFFVDTLIHIMPTSEFRLSVQLKMDIGSFLLNSATLFSKKEVTVKIEGKARLGKGLVYFNYPIHYVGKQDLRSIAW